MAFRHRGSYPPQAPPKDPNERLDYSSDWTSVLGGDTISNSSWVIPEGLEGDGTSINGSLTMVWLKGGTAGEVYRLTNRIITSGGRTLDRSMIIRCLEQ